MKRIRPDGGSVDRSIGGEIARSFDLEELRRRNANAVAMDVLYLLTTAFFALLSMRGFWPAVIAAVPLATLLYFGWKSSIPFLVAQVLAIAVTVGAASAGVVPL